MKNLKFVLMTGLFLLICLVAYSQSDSTQYPTPGSIIDIFSDLKGWFASTATVAGLTIFLTYLLTSLLKILNPTIRQVVALVIAIILMFAGNIANWGFMAEFSVITTIVYGLVVGFMANGLYDTKNVVK